MKAWTLLLGLPLVLLLGCSGSDEETSGRLRVTATTTQIGDFASNVGGNRISLTVLLKPNQDAHDFAPEPSQVRRLKESSLILRNGLGLDAFLDKTIGGQVKTVDVSEGIRPRRDDDGEPDPHIWFSVANAKVMVGNIRDALAAADSTNAAAYRENAGHYLQSLDALAAKIKDEVSSIAPSCRKLVTNHDVLGYYAAAYGFTIVGSVIPSISTEARASSKDVADIVRRVKAEGVPAIFAETSANPALIKQVGREAGVKVIDDLYGDSLGPKSSAGATYAGMIEANTRKIVDALRGCRA